MFGNRWVSINFNIFPIWPDGRGHSTVLHAELRSEAWQRLFLHPAWRVQVNFEAVVTLMIVDWLLFQARPPQCCCLEPARTPSGLGLSASETILPPLLAIIVHPALHTVHHSEQCLMVLCGAFLLRLNSGCVPPLSSQWCLWKKLLTIFDRMWSTVTAFGQGVMRFENHIWRMLLLIQCVIKLNPSSVWSAHSKVTLYVPDMETCLWLLSTLLGVLLSRPPLKRACCSRPLFALRMRYATDMTYM